MQITFDQMKYRQEVGGCSLTKVGELPISTLLFFVAEIIRMIQSIINKNQFDSKFMLAKIKVLPFNDKSARESLPKSRLA